MSGEIAECQVPSATVSGPVVQVFEHQGIRRLVVALPQSAILISQEWLATVARWTLTAGPALGSNGECENRVYTGTRGEAHKLAMNNGLPYLSNELFWKAMEDISAQAKLISGHSSTPILPSCGT